MFVNVKTIQKLRYEKCNHVSEKFNTMQKLLYK
jgi:hypothetical protein